MNTRVISFSLWGDNPKYLVGAVENARLAQTIYPDFEVWIYSGLDTPPSTIAELAEFSNCKVIHTNQIGNWAGMFWRFQPAWDLNVDVMLSRDCDSRLSMRERHAVEEWLQSGCGFHIMRDHPWHDMEILGGMWGTRGRTLLEVETRFSNYVKGDYWQVDQEFLTKEIYPIIKDDCFVHDSFFNYESFKRPFPCRRKGLEFVGEPFGENGERDEAVISPLKKALENNCNLTSKLRRLKSKLLP